MRIHNICEDTIQRNEATAPVAHGEGDKVKMESKESLSEQGTDNMFTSLEELTRDQFATEILVPFSPLFCNETIFFPQLARFLIRNSHHAFSTYYLLAVGKVDTQTKFSTLVPSLTLVSLAQSTSATDFTKQKSSPFIYYWVRKKRE